MDLEQQEAVAKLTAHIAANPKTRKRYFELVKEVAPGTPIPEIDAPKEFETAVVEPLRKENLALKQRLDRMELNSQVAAVWDGVKREHKLTDEELPAVRKIMEDKLIASPATAAEFYKQGQRLGTPRLGRDSLQVPWRSGQEQFKGLFENRDQWARNAAHAAVRDIELAREGR